MGIKGKELALPKKLNTEIQLIPALAEAHG